MKSSWMLVAGLLFGLMGVFVKLGAPYFSHVELVLYRSLFGLLMVYGIMRHQRISIATRHWRAHLWRGISGSVAGVAYLNVRQLAVIGEPDTRTVFYFSLIATLGSCVWILFDTLHVITLEIGRAHV